MKKILPLLLFLHVLGFSYGQCSYTGTPLSQVGSVNTFCIDLYSPNTIITGSVYAGEYVTINVVKGFTYTFSVGNVFSSNENLTILNATTNTNVSPVTSSSGASGTTISNWVASLSGQIKLLLSRGSCINDNTVGGNLTLTLNSIGNTQDNQADFGTNQWVGHVYNWTGGFPPGGTSPSTPSNSNPFTAANYVGQYNISSESISEGFGGDYNCFSVMSNGTARVNILTELYATRYRMRSTKPAGCYVLSFSGDDGIRLYIDNVLVFNEWKEQGPTTYCNRLVYLNGNSDLVLDYYENSGGNIVNFSLTPFNNSTNTIAGSSTINVCSGVSPGSLNASAYTCPNATPVGLSYQWQQSTDNITFTDISGATSEDYTPPTITTSTNDIKYFRRSLKSIAVSSCIFYSNVIRVNTSGATVLATPGTISGTISQCISNTGQVYSIAAVTNALSYTWTVPGGFVITAGQGTNSITVTTSSYTQTANISVVATNGCASATSGSRTLSVTVVPTTVGGGVFGGTTPICINSSTGTMTLGGGYVGSVVRWEKRLDSGSWTTISNTAITYSESPSISGTWDYRAVVKNANCPEVPSSAFSVVVNPTTVAGTASSNQTICSGTQPANITLSGSTGLVQWQSSADNSTFVNISGATGTTLTSAQMGSLSSPTYYRAVLSNSGCNTQNSNSILVSINSSSGGSATSNQTVCPGTTPTSISLTGHVGTVLRWESSTNMAFSSPSVIANTSTTLVLSPINVTTYYRAVVQNGSCAIAYSNTVSKTITTTTYYDNAGVGVWDNGFPNGLMTIVFNKDYTSTSDINGCSCTVNSGKNLTISSGHTLTLQNELTNFGGAITFEDTASLLQILGTTNINSGTIRYKRKTRVLPNNYDYVYWSSPVSSPDQAIGTIWMASNWADTFYSWNTNTNYWASEDASTVMTPAKGYISRSRNGQAGTNIEGATQTYTIGNKWEALFKGVPNNGDITFIIKKSGAYVDNLIGNPYPSALDLESFYDDSNNTSKITGVFRFWISKTALTNNQYSAPDYAIYQATTGVGVGTASVNNPALVPDKYVDSGQGFFAYASSTNAASETVTFKNSHRASGNNNSFYRVKNENQVESTIENHNVWLNLFNSQDVFKQQLVQYAQGATLGYEERLDVETMDSNEYIDFYSLALNNKYTLQSRPLPFVISDQVPLGYKTAIAGNFTIAIDRQNGLFDNQNIYLQDNITNTIHNLKIAPYNFTTALGTFDNRFVLRYTDNTLDNASFNNYTSNSVFVSKDKTQISIKSLNESLLKVNIYDLLGRNLLEKNSINAKTVSFADNAFSHQTLIVKILLTNGTIVTKKIIY